MFTFSNNMWCIKIKKNYQNPGHFYIMCMKIRTGDLYSAEYCYYVYRSTVSRIGFKSSLAQLKCKKTSPRNGVSTKYNMS